MKILLMELKCNILQIGLLKVPAIHPSTNEFYTGWYLNSLIRGDATDNKDFPDLRFSHNTTSNVVLAGHPGYLIVWYLQGSQI